MRLSKKNISIKRAMLFTTALLIMWEGVFASRLNRVTNLRKWWLVEVLHWFKASFLPKMLEILST